MIRTLDHEIGELKISNRDLQKDLEGCQARESKMLALQSELSRTNALLRSENTIFNNQVEMAFLVWLYSILTLHLITAI